MCVCTSCSGLGGVVEKTTVLLLDHFTSKYKRLTLWRKVQANHVTKDACQKPGQTWRRYVLQPEQKWSKMRLKIRTNAKERHALEPGQMWKDTRKTRTNMKKGHASEPEQTWRKDTRQNQDKREERTRVRTRTNMKKDAGQNFMGLSSNHLTAKRCNVQPVSTIIYNQKIQVHRKNTFPQRKSTNVYSLHSFSLIH